MHTSHFIFKQKIHIYLQNKKLIIELAKQETNSNLAWNWKLNVWVRKTSN